VTVPDLTGLTVDQAAQRLAGAGLALGQQSQRSDKTVPAGELLSWTGEGGQLPKGSRVDVVVSTGKPTVPVPNVQGKTFADAQAALAAVGLTAVEDDEFNDAVPKGQVAQTNPPAGAAATVGSQVTVTVSKGPDLVTVPDVRGRTVDAATQILEQAGFRVSEVVGSPDHTVFVTNPMGGTQAKRGSAVALYTS
jgi:serine/threonine-protein kinase